MKQILKYISEYDAINNGYNITSGGENMDSEFASKNISDLWKNGVYDNRVITEEHKKNISRGLMGKKNTDRQKRLVAEKLSSVWEVTSPIGEVTIIKNLNAFCKEQNLDQGNLSRGSHKKWKARKII